MGRSWRQKLKQRCRVENEYLRTAMSEFFGTAVLVFLTVSMNAVANLSRMRPDGSRGPEPSLLHLAFGNGVAVTIGIMVSGKSGAHLNPAITAGMTLLGRISFVSALVFWVSQYLGAFFGAGISCFLYHDALGLYDGGFRSVGGEDATAHIFATYPAAAGVHIRPQTAFFDQVITGAFLMFGTLAILDPPNWEIPKPAVPIFMGMLVSSVIIAMGYNTGAALNPARDLMPRLVTYLAGWPKLTFSYWNYNWFWMPVIGPHLGAMLGVIIYQSLIGAHWPYEKEDEQHDQSQKSGDAGNSLETKGLLSATTKFDNPDDEKINATPGEMIVISEKTVVTLSAAA